MALPLPMLTAFTAAALPILPQPPSLCRSRPRACILACFHHRRARLTRPRRTTKGHFATDNAGLHGPIRARVPRWLATSEPSPALYTMGNAATSTSGENQAETKTSSSNGGGCPVIHSKGPEPGRVLVEESPRKTEASGGCPVKNGEKQLPPISIRVDPRNMMPVTPENYQKKKTKQSHVVLSKTRRDRKSVV